MPVSLNLLPIRFDKPDVVLSSIPLAANVRPKDIVANPEQRRRTKVIHQGSTSHMVGLDESFLSVPGSLPQRYEFATWKPLGAFIAERAIEDTFKKDYKIRREKIGTSNDFAILALTPHNEDEFEHLVFLTGVYLRIQSFGEQLYTVIDWKAKVEFKSSLLDLDMQAIAKGMPVILGQSEEQDPYLKDFKGHYIGKIQSVGKSASEILCRDGLIREINNINLYLESSPSCLSLFNKRFPRKCPAAGIVPFRMTLERGLIGGVKNPKLFKDRLQSSINFLSIGNDPTRDLLLDSHSSIGVSLELTPLAAGEEPDETPQLLHFPQPKFVYQNGPRAGTFSKRIEGILKDGPYQSPPLLRPNFMFIFAEHNRLAARRLFLALRDGVGYFKGIQAWFQIPFSNDQVSSLPVEGVSIHDSNQVANSKYKIALEKINSSNKPDLAFVIHEKSDSDEISSPYYIAKSILLNKGIITQSVTAELINNAKQFEWAAGNIALAAFAKIGGIPWTVKPTSNRRSLIIGIGKSEHHHKTTRDRRYVQTFSTCVTSDGQFGFVSISPSVDETLSIESLAEAAKNALSEAVALGINFDTLVIHLTGQLKRAEIKAIEYEAKTFSTREDIEVAVLSISNRGDIFAVSDSNDFGLPSRGDVVRIRDSQYLVFTEGVEDVRAFRQRQPSTIQVKVQYVPRGMDDLTFVSQVYDLSQVNYRGFNSSSEPVSLLYSNLIARLLRNYDVAEALKQNEDLKKKLWFL